MVAVAVAVAMAMAGAAAAAVGHRVATPKATHGHVDQRPLAVLTADSGSLVPNAHPLLGPRPRPHHEPNRGGDSPAWVYMTAGRTRERSD